MCPVVVSNSLSEPMNIFKVSGDGRLSLMLSRDHVDWKETEEIEERIYIRHRAHKKKIGAQGAGSTRLPLATWLPRSPYLSLLLVLRGYHKTLVTNLRLD